MFEKKMQVSCNKFYNGKRTWVSAGYKTNHSLDLPSARVGLICKPRGLRAPNSQERVILYAVRSFCSFKMGVGDVESLHEGNFGKKMKLFINMASFSSSPKFNDGYRQ